MNKNEQESKPRFKIGKGLTDSCTYYILYRYEELENVRVPLISDIIDSMGVNKYKRVKITAEELYKQLVLFMGKVKPLFKIKEIYTGRNCERDKYIRLELVIEHPTAFRQVEEYFGGVGLDNRWDVRKAAVVNIQYTDALEKQVKALELLEELRTLGVYIGSRQE